MQKWFEVHLNRNLKLGRTKKMCKITLIRSNLSAHAKIEDSGLSM